MNVSYVLCSDGVERFTNVKEAVKPPTPSRSWWQWW